MDYTSFRKRQFLLVCEYAGGPWTGNPAKSTATPGIAVRGSIRGNQNRPGMSCAQ
jgi:hypothetical protein